MQNKIVQNVVVEARRRRGLPMNCNLLKGRPFSRLRYEGSVIYHSLKARHVFTSAKHLLALLRWQVRRKNELANKQAN
jgi:hypothetical protein